MNILRNQNKVELLKKEKRILELNDKLNLLLKTDIGKTIFDLFVEQRNLLVGNLINLQSGNWQDRIISITSLQDRITMIDNLISLPARTEKIKDEIINRRKRTDTDVKTKSVIKDNRSAGPGYF